MVIKVFAIRDNKMSNYHAPFFTQSEIQAVRTMHMAMDDDRIQLSFFAEDFELFQLGTFDDVTARFTLFDNPKFIVAAITIKNMMEKEKMRRSASEEQHKQRSEQLESMKKRGTELLEKESDQKG